VIAWTYPNLLHLAALLPTVAVAALLLHWRRRRHAAAALGDPALVRRLVGTDLRRFPRRSAALLVLAAASLGVAAAGPRWGNDAPAERDGPPADLVLVLDVSNSMLVRDVAADRLERQREAARAVVARAGGGRVGLVVFAGSGHVVAPLTTDHAMIGMYLDALSPAMAYQGGSAVSSGIRQAVRLIRVPGEARRAAALVLMGDGEAHEPAEAIRLATSEASRARVPVHAVGIGTERGGPVPDVDPVTGLGSGFKREPTGEVAVSRLDRDLLRTVARATGGTYVDADAPGALDELAAELGRVRAVPGAPVPGNRYAWFVALALALVAADAAAEARGRRRPAAEGRG
jgi:Ca-activated chloride channel homolog